MEAASDAEVIGASLLDPRAFAEIFERHYDVVRAYLSRRLEPAVADDLSSATFVAAFESRHRYDRSRPGARAWLLGIATNLLRHHARSEARRLRAYARLDPSPPASDAIAAAETRLDARRAVPALVDALVSLTPEERDVLLLFAWADLAYDEIAAALGIPVGTVRSRLHRARTRARERLDASGQYGPSTMKEARIDG